MLPVSSTSGASRSMDATSQSCIWLDGFMCPAAEEVIEGGLDLGKPVLPKDPATVVAIEVPGTIETGCIGPEVIMGAAAFGHRACRGRGS